jgi:hypothetical protein
VNAGERAGDARPVGSWARRWDDLEALGLLVGILAVLLVLAVTMGATPLI